MLSWNAELLAEGAPLLLEIAPGGKDAVAKGLLEVVPDKDAVKGLLEVVLDKDAVVEGAAVLLEIAIEGVERTGADAVETTTGVTGTAVVMGV